MFSGSVLGFGLFRVVLSLLLVLATATPSASRIGIGFTEAFLSWASPYADWKGPTPIPGVCDDRCYWETDADAAQFFVHPAFALKAPGPPRFDALKPHQKLVLYCMEPTCHDWAFTNQSHPQIEAVVGWHPGFDYWTPMECPSVLSLAFQERSQHLEAVRRRAEAGVGLQPGQAGHVVPPHRRAPIVSVLTNCLEWRRDFLQHLSTKIPIDQHGSCLHNVLANETKLLLTGSSAALQEPIDAAGQPFTLQANKLQTIRDYTFAVAYENSFANHYVTEKVYDALMMGVVPVYFGAPNIESYVNPECAVLAKQYGGPDTSGGLSIDNDALAQELADVLADAGRLEAMRSCPRPVDPQAPHVERCVELLRNPKVSPLVVGNAKQARVFSTGDTTPMEPAAAAATDDPVPEIRLPDAMAALRPDQESTLFFCAVCDAVWKEKGERL